VRLLVAQAGAPVEHRRFTDLPGALEPGDLVVVTTSDTEPAALDGTRATTAGRWCCTCPARTRPAARSSNCAPPTGRRVRDARAGERCTSRAPSSRSTSRCRARPRAGCGAPTAPDYRPGGPVTYSHLRGHWPLAAHRTVFATPVPGEFASAEMPSAGRPFTRRVLDGLAARGVAVAPLVLHTGLSSPEAGRRRCRSATGCPAATWDAVRAAAGRVVAVGTTVTRALEAVAATGELAGWTDLVLSRSGPLVSSTGSSRAGTNGGLAPAAAGGRGRGGAGGPGVRRRLDAGYLWHEFGDSCLLLPGRSTARRAA
jgi:S-adenosylmethionine:tRNA ribosyltransferase-isomerase